MNVAEVLLRLGCAMVAWMVTFTQLIWLATLRVTGCAADGDQLWRLLLGFAVISIGFSFLLLVSRPLKEVHGILRWFVVPAALLLPLALPPVLSALSSATLGSTGICSEVAKPWHPYWAPVQLAALAAIAWNGWRTFRNPL